MPAWTSRQIEILRENAHLGVRECQRLIMNECMVFHSRYAVEAMASRLKISLRRLETCPECGVMGVTINKHTGICVRCTALQNLEETRAFNAILRAEREELEAELEQANRDYDKLRQRNSRMCRKYGLKSKRERESSED